MSCDNAIYHSAVDLDRCLSPNLELGDDVTATEPDVKRRKSLKQGRPGLAADQSKAKGHRHEAQPRIIPDSTEIDPEYVWGDEGPIND
jgi:hypothetical protein